MRSDTKPPIEKPRLLITGGCGFLGSNLVHYFSRRGFDVCALVGPSGDDWRLTGLPNVNKQRLDIEDRPATQALLSKVAPQVVINCAVYGAYPSQTNVEKIYRVNLNAVRSLMESCQAQKDFLAFIQAGTSSEYGTNSAGPSETQGSVPDSHYAISKLGASGIVQLMGKKNNFPAWSLRLYSVYGPYEESSRLIPRLLSSLAQGELPPLVDSEISRDFIHVDDVCRVFETVMAKAPWLPRGEVYNIGTGVRTTLRDLVSLASKIYSQTQTPVWGSMPNRSWDNPNWYGNPEKANRALQWKAEIQLAEGLKKMGEWMDSHSALFQLAQKKSVLAR